MGSTSAVDCFSDICGTEMPAQSGPSRVSKLVARYSELGKSLSSPLDEVTSSAHRPGSRGQSPVQEDIGGEETEQQM